MTLKYVLQLERSEDGQEDAGGVEDAERDDAREPAGGVELEDARKEQGSPRPHVARREIGGCPRRAYFVELSYKAVSHAGPITLHQQLNPPNVSGVS